MEYLIQDRKKVLFSLTACESLEIQVTVALVFGLRIRWLVLRPDLDAHLFFVLRQVT